MTRSYLQVALLVLCLWAALDRAYSSEKGPQSPDSAFQDYNNYKVLDKNEHVEHRKIEPATLLSKRSNNGDQRANSKDVFDSLTSMAVLGEREYVPCVIPFKYGHKWYDHCTTKDSDRLWCSYDEYYSGHWDYCYIQPYMPSKLYTTSGGLCVMPFFTDNWWKKVWHDSCLMDTQYITRRNDGYDTKSHCSSTEKYITPTDWLSNGNSWRECDYRPLNNWRGLQAIDFKWCRFPFTFGGIQYFACTLRSTPDGEDNRKAWCITDTSTGSWNYCRDVYKGNSGIIGGHIHNYNRGEEELIANATQPMIPTTYLMPKQSETALEKARRLGLGTEFDQEDLPSANVCARILEGEDPGPNDIHNAALDMIKACREANYPENAQGTINLVKVHSPTGEQRNELWYM